MSNSTQPRIPYDKRSNWMAERHYQYGKKTHLQDIDSIMSWIEHTSGELAALAEFKNENELIEPYKYRQLITLADNSKIPCYIVVGAREPYVYYYVIPLNSFCKAIPTMDKPRYFSERNYVRFLHYIRKMKAEETLLENMSNLLPPVEERFQPNIKEIR